jgi:hypothetical protein
MAKKTPQMSVCLTPDMIQTLARIKELIDDAGSHEDLKSLYVADLPVNSDGLLLDGRSYINGTVGTDSTTLRLPNFPSTHKPFPSSTYGVHIFSHSL